MDDLLVELTSGDDRRAEAAVLSVAAYGVNAIPYLAPLMESDDADVRWWLPAGFPSCPSSWGVNT